MNIRFLSMILFLQIIIIVVRIYKLCTQLSPVQKKYRKRRKLFAENLFWAVYGRRLPSCLRRYNNIMNLYYITNNKSISSDDLGLKSFFVKNFSREFDSHCQKSRSQGLFPRMINPMGSQSARQVWALDSPNKLF